MLCYRCGSHNEDGTGQCTACGQVFTGAHKMLGRKLMSPTTEKSKGAPFAAGDVVAERFTIEALIGSGPSGHVYRAKDADFRAQGSDEIVALKVIHARLLQTDDDKALFDRALQRAKKMQHARIARVYHIDALGPRPFFTAQLVSGLPLSQIIELRKGQKTFSLAECEPIVQQLVTALDYAHRFAAHGMLKPQNIIVQPGELKITDFAITRGLPRKPYLAALGDALHYTAPELRKDGSDVLPAADVFSLGVVLTELLTGIRPDTTKRIVVPENPQITDAIRTFLHKAMDPSPDRRWRDPSELMQALQALVEEPMSEPIVITASVPVALPPPLAPKVDDVSIAERETQLLPLEEPVTNEVKVESTGKVKKQPKPAVRMVKKAPPPAKTVVAKAEAPRSMLVPKAQKSNKGAIIAAMTVFGLCVSFIGVAVWAREHYPNMMSSKQQAQEPDLALPAPIGASGLPTPAVEKVRKEEPVKVAALQAARPLPRSSKTEKPATIEPPAPVLVDKKEPCKKGMIFVPAGRFAMGSSPSDEFHNFSDKNLQSVDVPGFCVDRYEYPNAIGSQPLVNVNLKQAKAACENAGKRLCAEEEWERACKGPAGARFPYGNEFEEGACNVGTDEGPKSPKAIGTSPKCRSGFGVVDLSGNVAELTAGNMGNGDAIVKGGDAQHPDYASRCANRAAQNVAKRASHVGFRCCADAAD